MAPIPDQNHFIFHLISFSCKSFENRFAKEGRNYDENEFTK